MSHEPCLIDADLLRRYGGEGPRYTSYPTAMQFHAGIGLEAYRLALQRSAGARNGEPLSAYLHIPFCFSPCLYCACNKIVTHSLDRIQAYVERLLKEIELQSALVGRTRIIDQLHFGGGTPSYLTAKSLIEIMDSLQRHFGLTVDQSRDYSIEVDPRHIDPAKLHLLADLGFNRISFGVQDLDQNVQRAINRVQPFRLVEGVCDAARREGFRSINLDLIYGLPKQTLQTFGDTLRQVIGLRPDRLAVYGYAHMPSMFKAQRKISSNDLPSSAGRIALLQLAIQMLTEAGYIYIGMDHFALPGDALSIAKHDGTLHRSFQGYTTHARRDLIAMGVSAIGHVGDVYVQNMKTLKDYDAAIDRGVLPIQRGVQMNSEDHLRGEIIQQLMCRGYVDVPEIESRFGLSFYEHFNGEMIRLQGMESDGLVRLSGSRIELSDVGRFLMRSVAMVFDDYLPVREQRAPHSRVV